MKPEMRSCGQSSTDPEERRRVLGTAFSNKPWTMARRIMQTVAFFLFAAPIMISGWKLFGMTVGFDEQSPTPSQQPLYGSFASSSVFGYDLMDPLSYLQVLVASKALIPGAFFAALTVTVVYSAIRGRAFCGWVCPLGFVLELIDRLARAVKIPTKERKLPRHTKIWVAIGVVAASALTSIPIFETVSPISAVHRALLFGSTVGFWTLALVIVLELFWSRRAWCRAICPLGGFYEAIGRIGLVNVRIDHASCIGCDICKSACPADPEILNPATEGNATYVAAGDCMACGACVEACPANSLSMNIGLDHYRKQSVLDSRES